MFYCGQLRKRRSILSLQTLRAFRDYWFPPTFWRTQKFLESCVRATPLSLSYDAVAWMTAIDQTTKPATLAEAWWSWRRKSGPECGSGKKWRQLGTVANKSTSEILRALEELICGNFQHKFLIKMSATLEQDKDDDELVEWIWEN